MKQLGTDVGPASNVSNEGSPSNGVFTGPTGVAKAVHMHIENKGRMREYILRWFLMLSTRKSGHSECSSVLHGSHPLFNMTLRWLSWRGCFA